MKRGASGLLFLCLKKIKLAYTCRHTRAPQLLSQGVPPAKGAEQLGNSVQVFLNTYADSAATALFEAAVEQAHRAVSELI